MGHWYRHISLVINLLINLLIKLLNAVMTFLYK
jgi:hypothetical protein